MAVRLIVITGPTACGKTRLGVEVAHRLGSEIVSADSRQVYRGLDVGSGKDLDEYRRVDPPVPYHLIDVADPRETYSVFAYQRDCYGVLEACRRRRPFSEGTPLVMVGGSGLYVEAVLRGYRISGVREDAALRRRLADHERDELIEELRRLDPERLRRTDLSSTRRIVRAIEVAAEAQPAPVSGAPPCPIEAAVFSLDLPRDVLHRRIDARLETRLRQGLIAEVERLLGEGVPPGRLERLGLEYREVAAHLLGRKSESRMVDDLRRGIRRLAKRQRTWIRGMARRGIEVTRIGPGDAERLARHPWGERVAGRGPDAAPPPAGRRRVETTGGSDPGRESERPTGPRGNAD